MPHRDLSSDSAGDGGGGGGACGVMVQANQTPPSIESRLAKMQMSSEAMQRATKIHMLAIVRQHQINQVNNQLHSLHFFTGYCNVVKTKQLHQGLVDVRRGMQEGQVALGSLQHALMAQGTMVRRLDQSLHDLNDQVQVQEEKTERLETEVQQQRNDLTAALEDIDNQLTCQQASILEQDEALQRLLKVRFRLDFAVDATIMLVSYWSSSSRITSWILSPVVATLSTLSAKSLPSDPILRVGFRRHNRQRSKLMAQVMKLSLTMVVFRYLKRVAVRNGLHSLVGSFASYSTYMTDVGSTVLKKTGVSSEYFDKLCKRTTEFNDKFLRGKIS